MVQNHKSKVSDEKILSIYNELITLHEAAVKLNMTPVTLWRRAKGLGIKWADKKYHKSSKKIPLNEILEGLHPYYQTFKLKNRLLYIANTENIKIDNESLDFIVKQSNG